LYVGVDLVSFEACRSEIDYLDLWAVIIDEENILRLQIAVHDACSRYSRYSRIQDIQDIQDRMRDA